MTKLISPSCNFEVTLDSLAVLLQTSIKAINGRRKRQVRVLSLPEYRCLICDYLDWALTEAITKGDTADMGDMGFLQVVKVVSSRGWRFDLKYGGYDYPIMVGDAPKNTAFKFDEKFTQKALKYSSKMEYSAELNSVSRNMQDLLTLLNRHERSEKSKH